METSSSPSPTDVVEILARCRVGEAAFGDDLCGELRLVRRADGKFEVFVFGGFLPSGAGSVVRFTAPSAFAVFGNVAAQMLADEASERAL